MRSTMKRLGLATALVAMAACQESPQAQTVPPSPETVEGRSPQAASDARLGTFDGVGGLQARLVLAPEGEAVRVTLTGGGSDAAGAATAADCEIQAVGRWDDDRLEAEVVPFEGELATVTAEDLARNPVRITVVSSGGGLDLTTDYGGCGLGARLNGTYVMTSSADPSGSTVAVGDDLARVRAIYPDATLTIVEGYPWAGFAIQADGAPTLTFDGENAELRDGDNSQQRIGETVSWDDLKPGLRVTRVTPGP